MIARRIIPLFLLKGARLVKGTQFGRFTDVGDPLSQAMVYDAQGADEIIIVDIEASRQGRTIDTAVIERIIRKCRLPIGAGGGVKDIKDARRCFEAGADKIVVNTHAVLNPPFVRQLADEFGSQSVVVSIDVKKGPGGEYGVYAYAGKEKVPVGLEELVQKVISHGAGELLITSIDKEGTLSGFDIDLYRRLRDLVSVPLIASGGSGCYDHMVALFRETGADACAIGKMLFLRDYDIVRIKTYMRGRSVVTREA